MSFSDMHRSAARTWLAVTLLFGLIIVSAGALFTAVDRHRNARGDVVHNPAAVPSLTTDEARAVFQRFRTIARRSMFQPWIGWSELPFHSANVNVDLAPPAPTRRTVAPRRASAKVHRTIWLFGGSTAFGFGVTDSETVAAHLQHELAAAYPTVDIRVINHAHLGHYSSQEVALLQWLLRSGQSADAAVFLDGFNDSRFVYDAPTNTPPDPGTHAPMRHSITVSKNFPPARIGRFVWKLLHRDSATSATSQPAMTPAAQGAMAAKRYAANVALARASARPFGIAPLFVWQPTPYDYFDLEHDPLFIEHRDIYPPDPVVKPLNANVRATVTADDFIFLAPMFQGRSLRNTYVDSVHYGEEASRLLAAAIARAMIGRDMLRMSPKS